MSDSKKEEVEEVEVEGAMSDDLMAKLVFRANFSFIRTSSWIELKIWVIVPRLESLGVAIEKGVLLFWAAL